MNRDIVYLSDQRPRCGWVHDHPLCIAYHDAEWGTPEHDERTLFEFLILEGVQAGLSWRTILKKRQAYRATFDNFDPVKVAVYGEEDVARLLSNAGIIRNRLKIRATITNARQFLAVQAEFGSFDAYLWQFVAGETRQNSWQSLAQVPAETETSRAMSQDMKRRGFKFVGPVICYALMQAVGMVNDHLTTCFRYEQLSSGRVNAD